jgi:transcriptional regulator with XRE-family HTH domain
MRKRRQEALMSRRRVPEIERVALRRWLRHLVRSSGLSPNKLAKAAGVAQSTVTRFLNGYADYALSRDTIEKLAVAAQVDLPKLGDFAATAHQLLTADDECRNLIRQAVRLAGRVAHDREAWVSSITTNDPQALAAVRQDHETWFPDVTLLVLDCLVDLEKAGTLDASAIAALETVFTKLARDRHLQLWVGNPLAPPRAGDAPERSPEAATQPLDEDRQATAEQAAA